MALKRGLRDGAPRWATAAFLVGLALVFVGERVVPTIGWLRLLISGAGVSIVLALTAVRWTAAAVAEGERRTIERALAWVSTAGAAAVALYFTTVDAFEPALGMSTWTLAARHRYESLATVAGASLAVGTVVPLLFAERALSPMRRAERIEWRRVREALVAGVTLALAAVYGTLFTFIASETDVRADFSYFHTARPSESTRKIAAQSAEPIEVDAFFPPLNAVGEEVDAYLRDLAHGARTIQSHAYDRLLVPDLARKYNVSDDGVVVIARGPQHESISLGVEMAGARPKLKSLDADFQKALLKVLRPRRTAYFTVGHGELNDREPSPQNEGRTGKGIRELIEHQNYAVRDLGAATGLGADVPADASLVVVLGPQQPFLPEEVAALGRYAARGGKLFLCLDPEAKVDLAPLAALVGLHVSSSVLANERVHLRRRHNDSDNALLATNRYSSHPSVSTLARVSSRPLVLAGSGWLDTAPGNDPGLHVDYTVRALPDTFADEDGDFVFDSHKEHRKPFPVAAAVEKAIAPPGAGKHGGPGEAMRAVVIADADAVSDAVLGNEANLLFVADGVRWLGGEESFAGELATPEDVRIVHTKQKDLVWFYGSIFGVPAIVLGAGLLYARRARRSKKSPSKSRPPERPLGQVAA